MARKSWHLDRRTFLRGLGVACTLPYLEAMEPALRAMRQPPTPPRRALFLYFPNGCSLPEVKEERYRQWRWFPDGEGRDFRFTKVLAPLEPFREDLAIYGGLSHPKSRELLGHLAGDTWLTSGDLRGGLYQNYVSVDQVAAQELKQHTRFPSLVLSSDGGVGYKSRISTLSFDAQGRPLPSEHRQRAIFERYFAPGGGGTTEERRRAIHEGKKVVDLMLEESKSLEKRLGENDRRKLQELLSSIAEMEEQIRRNASWLDTPLPEFDASHVVFDAAAAADPTAYVRAMYDLIALAFQLDLTRVATYMLAREDAMGVGENWPRTTVGVDRGHHTISHDSHEGHWDQWGPFDRWYAEQFAHLLKRLRETSDAHGPLLDRTMVLYGSSCTTTHNARNYPTVLAGGRALGLRLGHHTRFSRTAMLERQNDALTGAQIADTKRRLGEDDLPFANLLLSMLHALGIETDAFADSEGPLEGFFA